MSKESESWQGADDLELIFVYNKHLGGKVHGEKSRTKSWWDQISGGKILGVKILGQKS
jgi:hypothetical protein